MQNVCGEAVGWLGVQYPTLQILWIHHVPQSFHCALAKEQIQNLRVRTKASATTPSQKEPTRRTRRSLRPKKPRTSAACRASNTMDSAASCCCCELGPLWPPEERHRWLYLGRENRVGGYTSCSLALLSLALSTFSTSTWLFHCYHDRHHHHLHHHHNH